MDSRPGQPSGAEAQSENHASSSRRERGEIGASVVEQDEAPTGIETFDYGAVPVASHSRYPAREDAPFDLPPIEDSASIQLALIEVAQALAANRIEPRRAGLLLYALQVASTNAKHVNIPSSSVRSISYTAQGQALAPQQYGWDVEDIEEMDREVEAEANQDDD
jgi:hypothetical protein